MTETPQPPKILTWEKGTKQSFMQHWSENVMGDQELSKGALRVAWGLSFMFHSEECRAWERQAAFAERLRVSESAIKAGLIELERRGHIIRAWEEREGRPIRAIRPCWNNTAKKQPRRQRRGGVQKGVDPREIALAKIGQPTERQTPLGTERQTLEPTERQTPLGTERQTPYTETLSLMESETSARCAPVRDRQPAIGDDDFIRISCAGDSDLWLSKE